MSTKWQGKARRHVWKDLSDTSIFEVSARGHRDLGSYFVLEENFVQKPGLNADMIIDPDADDATALAAHVIANKNFEVGGTNMTSALCTFREGGGITLTTAGANNDQAWLDVHRDTNQSAWAKAGTWGSENSPAFEAWIQTGASVASLQITFGMKLTATPTLVTDDDQFMFHFSTAIGTKWNVVGSRAGTDVTTTLDETYDSSALGTLATVTANTLYRLRVEVDSNRIPKAYINGIDVAPESGFAALVTAKDFYPFLGVQALTGAAKACSIIKLRGERLVA